VKSSDQGLLRRRGRGALLGFPQKGRLKELGLAERGGGVQRTKAGLPARLAPAPVARGLP
jgi:hypothetical protein